MKQPFVFGAATSSYQIEGAFQEGGKGLNIWDIYVREKGKIYNGHTGDIACDHYHRFREDIALMKEIGLQAYRFSINWARILPDGIGAVNQEGIRFYKELIEELKKDFTIVIVTHSMQQASRVSDDTAFFLMGEVIEFDKTSKIFQQPSDKRTEDYITGRFG